MAFVPTSECAKATFVFNINSGKPATIGIAFKSEAGEVNTALATELASALADFWEENALGLYGNTQHLNSIEVRDMQVQNGVVVNYTTGLPIAGTNVAAFVSAQVCFPIKLATGLAGKSFRGRFYWPFVGESTAGTNAWSSVAANNVVDFWNELREAMYLVGSGWTMCVVSKQTGGAPRANGLPTTITDVTYAKLKLGTQRRRLGDSD